MIKVSMFLMIMGKLVHNNPYDFTPTLGFVLLVILYVAGIDVADRSAYQ